MSSFDLGLDNWNPMAEDFNSQQFNSYNSEQSRKEYDLCALYVQNVPLDLLESTFQDIFSNFGRIVRFRILPSRPNKSFGIGLVSFETEAEAAAAKQQLHERPPLYLKINYANASKSNVAIKDVKMNLAKNTQSANQSVSRTLGRGRGQPIEAESFRALKVTVDGNKRIAYDSKEIPCLIPNPNLSCLVCKKLGESSCEVCKKPYCSAACQAEDWKNHKSVCEPMVDKKYNGEIHQNYKYDTGYMSAGSNSDSDKQTFNHQATDPNKNKLQNLLSKGRGSPISPEPKVSLHAAIPGRSQQDPRDSNTTFSRKQLTNIRINDIEDTALPLNRDEKVYVCNFQNPSKLWVHLKSAKLVLSDMEKKLNEVIDKSAISCSVNDVCCTMQDGVFRRVQVKEIKPNTVTVYFIDYGTTSTLRKDLMYHLPPMFKNDHSQAVCCKLLPIDGRENVNWNDEDFVFFQDYTKCKEFKMKAYSCYNNIYDVALVNDQGVSLMNIITQYFEDTKPNVLPNQCVPSVCSNLKEGIKVTIKAMDFDKEQLWGILNDVEGTTKLDKCLTDIDELLRTLAKDAKVVNMSCEEGEVAIGFSTEFQTFYRCVVLKRLRNSFLVRYIDYGNTEEITELRSATPPVLLKQSYVVCCTKPNSMSFETFKKVFSDTVTLSVKSVKNTVAELSFESESRPLILQCFPWYHGISTGHANQTTCKTEGKCENSFQSNSSNPMPSNNNNINPNKSSMPIKLANSAALNKTQGNILSSPVKAMKDIVPDEKLDIGVNVKSKFHIRAMKFQKLPTNVVSKVIICYEDEKKLYFQQQKDLNAITELTKQINSGRDQVLSGKPEVGNVYCCCSALYKMWYRARVCSVVSPNTYRVQFIDYGNTEDVSSENFKEIADDVFQLPVYCIPVLLEETVNKPATLESEKYYSVQVIEDKPKFPIVKFLPENSQKNVPLSSFERLTLQDGINKVNCFHSENSIYYCQLIDNTCAAMQDRLQKAELKPLSKGPEVNDVVCAKSSDGSWYRASIVGINKNICEVFFIDFGNSEMVSSENIKFLPEDFSKYPIFGIPVRIKNVTDVKMDLTHVFQLKANGFASDGSQFADIVLSKSTYMPNISSLKSQVLSVDQEVEVAFCHIENDIYYAQMASSQEMIESLGMELKNAASFENLVDIPKEKDIVCAKFSKDQVWYRGSIKNVSTDQKNCQVYFIDYGNTETVAFTDLKMLPSKLCDIPILAVPVKLVNLAELERLLLAEIYVFKIKVIAKLSDSITMVEIVTDNDIGCFSIETRVLPEALTEVVVTHKEGRVYYVQKESDVEGLREVMKNLQLDNSIKSISSPTVGQLVCVKFQDSLLYRGLVKEKSGNEVKVFFVDYGNTDNVTDVFNLPSQYYLPMFAIPIIISNEETLASPLAADSVCKVKFIGQMNDNIQIVRVCPPLERLLLTTLKTSILEKGSLDVRFHSSNDQFYFVSKATDISQMNEMNSKLANFSGDEIYHMPSFNEVLLVKSQERWQRGCVTRADETTKKCEVYLVDLGSTETIPFSNLSCVPKSITFYPVFLNKVILKYVDSLTEPIKFGKCYTITVVGNSKEIPIIKVLQPVMFTSIERKSLPLHETSKVIFYHKENDTLFLQDTKHIELIAEVQADARKCATSEVISHNPIVGELLCAQSDCDGDWYRCCIEEVSDSDKYRIHYIDYGNCEIVSRRNLRYLSKDLAMYPSFAIAVKIIDQVPIILEQFYSVVAVSEPVNGLQSVKLVLEEKVCKGPADEMPKVDQNVKETSTGIMNNESGEKFFYQSAENVTFSPGEQDVAISNVGDDGEMFCIPFVQENIIAFSKLTVDINKYCPSLDCSSYNADTLPEEGEMVLAKFSEDGQWYRAVVLDVNADPSFEVLFVDFGNSAVVDKDSLRIMKKEFMSLPTQAAPCCLAGFKVIGEKTSVITELKKFEGLEPKRAIVTIKKADGDEDDEGEIMMEIPIITKHLVEKGLVTVDSL